MACLQFPSWVLRDTECEGPYGWALHVHLGRGWEPPCGQGLGATSLHICATRAEGPSIAGPGWHFHTT